MLIKLGSGIVKAHGELIVEVIWNTKSEGAWRDIVTLEDGGRIKKDVPIVFKCIVPKVCLLDILYGQNCLIKLSLFRRVKHVQLQNFTKRASHQRNP